MKQIEKAIKFAIENGYQAWTYELQMVLSEKVVLKDKIYPYWESMIDIIRLITSKPFIEAIARGIIKESLKRKEKIKYDVWIFITINQALEIANNELEEFYKNLLPNNKEW